MLPRRSSKPGTADTSARAFGRLLWIMREAAGLSAEELSQGVHQDRSYVTKVESGALTPSLRFAVECDGALKTADMFARLHAEIDWKPQTDYHPQWFKKYVDLEAKAAAVHEWTPYTMPGLLQTERHMRVLFAGYGNSPARINELTEARLSRQEGLYGSEPIHLHSLIDESVLRRAFGSPHVAAEQLAHLLEASQLPNVVLQVVPLAPRPLDPPGSLMTLLDMPTGKRWLYSEALNAGYCTDEISEIQAHAALYDRAVGAALFVTASRALIRSIMGELINMHDAQRPITYSDLSVFKSSYSGGGNGGCFGAAYNFLPQGVVAVVDTKLGADSPILTLRTAAYVSLIDAVKRRDPAFAAGEQYVTP